MTPVVVRKLRAAMDVVLAAAAVRQARRTVAGTPLGSLVQSGATEYPAGPSQPLAPHERAVAARWGAAVDRALRWTRGDSACLVRASALRELVVGRGLPRATVRIGVRRGDTGFEAHAWVEQDGAPIAEPVMFVGAFASLNGVTLR